MTVEELIVVLRGMPQESNVAFILGCKNRFRAENLDMTRVQVTHRERGSNLVVEPTHANAEPVVGIVW